MSNHRARYDENIRIAHLALCESRMFVLKPYELYSFEPVEGCKECERLAQEAEEAYGEVYPRVPRKKGE